ncbi:hypothetical protein BD626DRAFT_559438 [Schizophyllum amplum]|uniref:RING-type domain-containing protein n=1 Tax=Schizophyllum amplum TaxID=97359 RepID=A0A550C552_9AGAR|nr:hypothetical protein BD626DRAFT_559438 [Auriculariopsis ampla]
MSSTKLHAHPSLPAPVVHAGFSVPQSKSHVLAGVQDAYWSDDEGEDAECPLCLEEMDISDLNFKPCVCGYQICRFCWHHIKENLNKRCPACRRVYTDEGVEFKPLAASDHKRLTQQKKQRERERKDLEGLGRRHLANVRVVQRNVVYVVGIGPRFAKEELIPTLRSTEYFGQYGKISKILLVKRTPSGGRAPVVGLYVTYHRREDAARAIAAVDGAPSPGGGKDVMRASYGTTKYCMSFLRGATCSDHACMNLHEWGDEKDCFTKEDLTTLKHTMKATESRGRKADQMDVTGLPRAAAWGSKPAITPAILSSASNRDSPTPAAAAAMAAASSGGQRSTRRGGARTRNNNASSTTAEPRPSRKISKAMSTTSSRPQTPAPAPSAPAATTVEEKIAKKVKESSPGPSHSPAPSSVAPEPPSPAQEIPEEAPAPPPAAPELPPGLPALPPGLSAPPGIPSPRPPHRMDTSSPQTPLLAPATGYMVSNAARALIDDVRLRRDAAFTPAAAFPDFDRTESGGFSFTFDPKLAEQAEKFELPTLDMEADMPFDGTYLDAFPALRPGASQSFMTPPGLSYPHNPNPIRLPTAAPMERQSTGGSSYTGSFNPFADGGDSSALDEDSTRKVSRFGFARGRQASATASDSPILRGASADLSHQQWAMQGRHEMGYGHTTPAIPSPLVQQAQPQSYPQQPPQMGRFQPFDTNLSEAQLRDFIQNSRERAPVPPPGMRNGNAVQAPMYKNQGFNDPAIMTARFASPAPRDYPQSSLAFGPPPGLSFPPVNVQNAPANIMEAPNAHDPPPTLSTLDFPALASAMPATAPAPAQEKDTPTSGSTEQPSLDVKATEKAEKKAAKKTAAAERAAERQRVAQEKAAAKAAEKARQAAEKEKAAAAKAQKEQEEKDRQEQERIAKAAERERIRAEKEQQAKLEKERQAQMQKEREAQVEKERAAKAKKAAADATKAEAKAKSQAEKAKATVEVPKAKLAESPSVAEVQAPLLSKKPKKNKPVLTPRPVKGGKESESAPHDDAAAPSHSHLPSKESIATSLSSDNSRAESVERELPVTINPTTKMPLEYAPLVHALSALSSAGESSASLPSNMPPGSIDNAVSSFQRLLETLTQTISDLLRLLPRATWDDSASFDGVLRDMLKGDDFLDDAGGDDPEKNDEVGALTSALERRARWMEVQLSKLEELHRDINTAAVRAVLAFNRKGYDLRKGNGASVSDMLREFDTLGYAEENGKLRPLRADELEKKAAAAKDAALVAEVDLRDMMEKMQALKPFYDYEL